MRNIDGLVVVGRSGMMRKPRRAMGTVMMPSMMKSPATPMSDWKRKSRQDPTHISTQASRGRRSGRCRHPSKPSEKDEFVEPIQLTVCKKPLNIGPMALAVYGGVSHAQRLRKVQKPYMEYTSSLGQLFALVPASDHVLNRRVECRLS